MCVREICGVWVRNISVVKDQRAISVLYVSEISVVCDISVVCGSDRDISVVYVHG